MLRLVKQPGAAPAVPYDEFGELTTESERFYYFSLLPEASPTQAELPDPQNIIMAIGVYAASDPGSPVPACEMRQGFRRLGDEQLLFIGNSLTYAIENKIGASQANSRDYSDMLTIADGVRGYVNRPRMRYERGVPQPTVTLLGGALLASEGNSSHVAGAFISREVIKDVGYGIGHIAAESRDWPVTPQGTRISKVIEMARQDQETFTHLKAMEGVLLLNFGLRQALKSLRDSLPSLSEVKLPATQPTPHIFATEEAA